MPLLALRMLCISRIVKTLLSYSDVTDNGNFMNTPYLKPMAATFQCAQGAAGCQAHAQDGAGKLQQRAAETPQGAHNDLKATPCSLQGYRSSTLLQDLDWKMQTFSARASFFSANLLLKSKVCGFQH